ncbi:hypothetical protein [Halorarius halobius]|nr:hypothetical protein [Halorarius halobius]
MNLSEYDTESMRALIGTAVSGTLILAAMTILLFGVPFAVFYFL